MTFLKYVEARQMWISRIETRGYRTTRNLEAMISTNECKRNDIFLRELKTTQVINKNFHLYIFLMIYILRLNVFPCRFSRITRKDEILTNRHMSVYRTTQSCNYV